jgi:CubicO group peptidase (beta-lactamase class C family)
MKNVQIKNLMNHTSGIPDYWQYNIHNHKDSIYAFLNNNDTLEFSLNSQHRYCNSGYFLLGQIIENVSGKRYVDFMHERIFIPLEMKNSFVNDDQEYNRAIGYDEQWNRNDFLISTGDGGMISTVLDLYLWDKALYNNTILSSKSKSLMFESDTLENGKTGNYGFGWEINKENRNIVYHTGWLASFGAYNQFDNETGYFLIILSNQIRPEKQQLESNFMNNEFQTFCYQNC